MRRLATSYGCLMIPVPEPLATQLDSFSASIPDKYKLPNDHDKEWHITVKYGILTLDSDIVAAVVSGVKPFSIKLGKAGVFHGDDKIVLKLAAESKGLTRLNREVCKRLKHEDSYVIYRPHLTIACLVKRIEEPYYYLDYYNDQFDGKEFVADTLVYAAPNERKYRIPMTGDLSADVLDIAKRV